MKKSSIVGLLALLCASACAEGKTINGKYYEPYGLIDKDEVRSPAVQYRTVTGNVVWSILLGESLLVPVWLCGFQLYEPVGPATEVSK